jgi:hypothetical protein
MHTPLRVQDRGFHDDSAALSAHHQILAVLPPSAPRLVARTAHRESSRQGRHVPPMRARRRTHTNVVVVLFGIAWSDYNRGDEMIKVIGLSVSWTVPGDQFPQAFHLEMQHRERMVGARMTGHYDWRDHAKALKMQ